MKPARALSALLGLTAVLLLGAAPAGAHGGPGEAEVTSITRDGDDVTITVRLVFTGDGDGVPDATVTVVVDDGLPVPMEPGAEEGDYQATVPAAAGATIRVTSVEPPTSVEATAPAADDAPTTTTAETTTTAPETTTTGAETDGTGLTEDGPSRIDEAPEDTTGQVILIGVLAVVVVAALIAALVLRKKPPTESTDA